MYLKDNFLLSLNNLPLGGKYLMKSFKQFQDDLNKSKGKTIAIVYIFEGDNSSGLSHFFIWKSDILTKWMNAVQDLHCLPLIIDVRTFVDKAINNTLPHIDYVLNMNSGTYALSSMALVPATCSVIGVPCIPCDAVSIVTGENKLFSNLIANSIGLNIPKNLNSDEENGIFRPINLGNSMGVKRGLNKNSSAGIYQEFIKGYDITTPIAKKKKKKKMELLPTVMYIPKHKDLNWFNGEREKITRNEHTFKIVNLDSKTQRRYLELVNTLSIKTFCRIDARVKCLESNIYHNETNNTTTFKDIYFIEINVMPTIRENNNFTFSFNSISTDHPLYPCINIQKDLFGSIDLHKFLLASSMMSLTKTMY